jgi:membrane protein DedA with SNARE-associated domain/rhodanese-related sulfurtransferase
MIGVLSFQYLLLRHGYLLLFFYVLAVAIGIPVPADPFMLLMGALVGNGQYTFLGALVTAVVPAVLGDALWYRLGRSRGRSVLGLLCKLSLEPDTCVRKTEAAFASRGWRALLFAKFVPGMSLVSVSLAGISGMPYRRFLFADTAGCFLWAGAYLAIGRIFHRQVDAVVSLLGLFGRRAGLVAACLVALYIGAKYLQRLWFRRKLRINRISAAELNDLLSRGQPVTVVDLRHPAEIERDGVKIAGALILRPDNVRARARELPRDREIVLYCTCPNEVTSARVAQQLRAAGVRHIRPLAGGLDGWRALGFPLEPAGALEAAAVS